MSAKLITVISLAVTLMLAAPGFAVAQDNDPQAFARGVQAWQENCARRHNLRDPQERVDHEWDIVATHMRIRANIPGEAIEDIKLFLKGSND